jgi:hypothetical protein
MYQSQTFETSRLSLEIQRHEICRNITHLRRLVSAGDDDPERRMRTLRLLGQEMARLLRCDEQARARLDEPIVK